MIEECLAQEQLEHTGICTNQVEVVKAFKDKDYFDWTNIASHRNDMFYFDAIEHLSYGFGLVSNF